MTMIRKFSVIWYLTILCITISSHGMIFHAHAAVDEMRLTLLENYELPLRWDNIEGGELIVYGPEPAYNSRYDMHLFNLVPGREIKVKIPEKKVLRIVSPDTSKTLEGIKISVSNGTGLHGFLPVPFSADKSECLVIPEDDAPVLCRIYFPAGDENNTEVERKALEKNISETGKNFLEKSIKNYYKVVKDSPVKSRKNHLKIAIFLSRQEMLENIFSYRKRLPLTGEPVLIKEGNIPGTKKFWRIGAYHTNSLQVNGPSRVAIENRLLYPENEQNRRVRYFVKLLMDGKEQNLFSFHTPPETLKTLFIEGRPRVCGRLQTSFLNIPQGEHTLTILPYSDVVLRVLCHEASDYLLESLNAPEGYKETFNKVVSQNSMDNRFLPCNQFAGIGVEGSTSGNSLNSPAFFNSRFDSFAGISDVVRRDDVTTADVERAAQIMVRDNNRPHGPLLGVSLMAREAKKRPDAPEVKKEADAMFAAHTFFRNLYPSLKPDNTPVKFLKFILPRMRGNKNTHMVVAEQHAGKLSQLINEGCFLDIPESGNPLFYKIPERVSPSKIRILVTPKEVSRNFYIRFDDDNPLAFRVEPSPELSSREFRITSAEAGNALHAFKHDSALNSPSDFVSDLSMKDSTMSNPEAASPGDEKFPFEPPLYLNRMITPAFFEINLPDKVQGFTLWGENRAGAVAIQYLDSLPYRMTESEYLNALSIEGSGSFLFEGFSEMLKSGPGDGTNPSPFISGAATPSIQRIRRELENYWIPVIRMIRSHYSVFNASVTKAFETPRKRFSDAETSALIKKASTLESNHHSLAALENWADLFNSTEGQIRIKAAFKVTEQLVALGETYLAESFLKQLFFSDDRTVSEQAFERLVSFYENGGATHQLLPLHCARAVIYPTSMHVKALADLLLQNGDFFHAMVLGSVLPLSVNPEAVLLKAALNLGWYQLADLLIQNLESPGEKAYQHAMSLLHQSKYDEACEFFNDVENAGEENSVQKARVLKKAVLEGRRIKDNLFSSDRGERVQGILDWESWYADLPGACYWQAEQTSVRDYDGCVRVYSKSRNLHAMAFRSVPSKSVKARFYGPLRLKISVRVLHPENNPFPVNAWFTVHNSADNKNHVVPITNNTPAYGLTLPGETSLVPGRITTYEMNLEPGVNEIEVHSKERSLLVMFHLLRPSSPVTEMLPTLSIANAEMLLTGDFKTPMNIFQKMDCWSQYDCLFNDCLTIISMDNKLYSLNVSEFRRAQRQAQKQEESLEETISWDALAAERRKNMMNKKQHTGFRRVSSMENETVFEKMAELVLASEKTPESILKIEADARRLFSKHSHLIGLKTLLNRITGKTTWKPLSMVQADAGIRDFPIDRWQPESDSIRVRKALIPGLLTRDQVISNEKDLVFYMNNTESIVIKARLLLLDLPVLPPAPVKLFYQLDNNSSNHVAIYPDSPEYIFSVPVPRGAHRLTTGFIESYSNQFITANFCERPSTGELIWKDCTGIQPDNAPRRLFYVATPSTPVKAQVKGPAWVRIDKLTAGETIVDYRYVDDGWQELTLKPDKNEAESLFRLHRRIVKYTLDEPLKSRPVKVTYDNIPEPYGELSSSEPLKWIRFKDAYPPGSQEDGTWSLTGSYRSPLNIDEDTRTLGKKDDIRIYELKASHHYHARELPGYFTTSMTECFRNHGGPVLGLQEDLYYYPGNYPLGLNINADFYMQNPAAETFNLLEDFSAEYSGVFKARIFQTRRIGMKLFHIPSFSAFGRVLSISDGDEYPDSNVDRRIFTSYKKDHKQGVALSEYMAFYPWLDTVLFLQGGVNSNENLNLFNPDNMKMQVGWKQLMGAFQTSLKYSHAYYFEDHDRKNDIKRNLIDLEFLWNRWMPDQQRFNLALGMTRDLDNDENAFLFSFSWFFSRGLGLKDIRPGDLDFYGIHKRNLPREMNNAVWKE